VCVNVICNFYRLLANKLPAQEFTSITIKGGFCTVAAGSKIYFFLGKPQKIKINKQWYFTDGTGPSFGKVTGLESVATLMFILKL